MTRGQKICIFIIDVLSKKGPMTRQEVTQSLKAAFPNDAVLPRSTWNRYLDNIQKSTPYAVIFDSKIKKYTLMKSQKFVSSNESLLAYLLSSYNVMESAPLLIKHSDKIYNADVIAGTSAINIILQAIDEHRGLTFTYTSFVNNTTKIRNFIPYFLSSWEGRWYLVAEAETHPGNLYMYALDRMSEIRLSFDKVRRNVDISLEEYFKYSYGIQHSTEVEAMDIIIRAFGHTAKYIRSKPIHPSQVEISTQEEYSDFKLHLAPCYNFIQNLMFYREGIEVMEPEEIKSEFKDILNKMLDYYK